MFPWASDQHDGWDMYLYTACPYSSEGTVRCRHHCRRGRGGWFHAHVVGASPHLLSNPHCQLKVLIGGGGLRCTAGEALTAYGFSVGGLARNVRTNLGSWIVLTPMGAADEELRQLGRELSLARIGLLAEGESNTGSLAVT